MVCELVHEAEKRGATKLDRLFPKGYIVGMWEVEYVDSFEGWWATLDDAEQESVGQSIDLLAAAGPHLEYPHSSSVERSIYRMRELRIQHKGDPYRVFYVFDPRRTAILLFGGNKVGDDRFYDREVPRADRLYEEYLQELSAEGLI